MYHIKDNFFYVVNDKSLMQNHEQGKKRPTYFAVENKNILCFIPLSSKVDKYQKIIDKKIKRYGFCNTILIRKVMGVEHAILLQNAFPTTKEYIDHVHTVNGLPIKVIDTLKMEILKNYIYMIKLKERGINLFFTDIDKIKEAIEKFDNS